LEHQIVVLGGELTAEKREARREMLSPKKIDIRQNWASAASGIPVVVTRTPLPTGVTAVGTVEEVLTWR